MNSTDALREIAEKLYPYIDYLPPDGPYAKLMDWYRNRFIDMVTALISEGYVSKELVNQEVERRIKERMPNDPELMQEFEGAYGYLSNPTKRQIWRHSLWAIELYQRRLTQKTEGGGE